MATLQLTDSNTLLLRPFLDSSIKTSNRHFRISQARFVPKASSSSSSLSRRQFVVETAAISVSLAPLIGFQQPARSDDGLSEWERVYLPIDPGVVLLDIAFVPDDTNHGRFRSLGLRFFKVLILISENVLIRSLLVRICLWIEIRILLMNLHWFSADWLDLSVFGRLFSLNSFLQANYCYISHNDVIVIVMIFSLMKMNFFFGQFWLELLETIMLMPEQSIAWCSFSSILINFFIEICHLYYVFIAMLWIYIIEI